MGVSELEFNTPTEYNTGHFGGGSLCTSPIQWWMTSDMNNHTSNPSRIAHTIFRITLTEYTSVRKWELEKITAGKMHNSILKKTHTTEATGTSLRCLSQQSVRNSTTPNQYGVAVNFGRT